MGLLSKVNIGIRRLGRRCKGIRKGVCGDQAVGKGCVGIRKGVYGGSKGVYGD